MIRTPVWIDPIGAVHAHQLRGHQADAEGDDRNQGLHHKGEQSAEKQRQAGGNLQAGLEPWLIRQRCRRLLDQHQSEQHRTQFAVAVPIRARDDKAAHANPE